MNPLFWAARDLKFESSLQTRIDLGSHYGVTLCMCNANYSVDDNVESYLVISFL